MPRASYGDRHCISVIHSKTHIALDFTSRIIDFFVIREGEDHKGSMSSHMNALAKQGFFYACVPSYWMPTFPLRLLRFLSIHPSTSCAHSRRPQCSCGAGGGGAGCGGSPVCWMACHPDPLPGAAALLSHHLLPPRLQHSPQAVGAHPSCWGGTEHTLLQQGLCTIDLVTYCINRRSIHIEKFCSLFALICVSHPSL